MIIFRQNIKVMLDNRRSRRLVALRSFRAARRYHRRNSRILKALTGNGQAR